MLCMALVLCAAGWQYLPAPRLAPAELTQQALRYLHAEGVERDPTARSRVFVPRRGRIRSRAFELPIVPPGRGMAGNEAPAAARCMRRGSGEQPPQRLMASCRWHRRKRCAVISANGTDLQLHYVRRADWCLRER